MNPLVTEDDFYESEPKTLRSDQRDHSTYLKGWRITTVRNPDKSRDKRKERRGCGSSIENQGIKIYNLNMEVGVERGFTV